MPFAALGLNPAILKALADAAYREPTAVQAQTIPLALAGHDLMVSSQTGSGKTASFILPAIQRFAFDQVSHAAVQAAPQPSRGRPRTRAAQPRMLVLTPTRELALQVTEATGKYTGGAKRIEAAAILGGMPYPKQMQLLARNPTILVATPGRLIDHMQSGKIDFSQLQILVLDEADRMLDMGFVEDIEKIVAATPDSRQTMLFSATLDGLVGKMAQQITRDAKLVKIASSVSERRNITQRLHFVDDVGHKNRLLDYLLRDIAIDQAVVFTATKRDADGVAERLTRAGFAAAALHGDMQQFARNRTLNALRSGQVRVLVATDVAARGIDVPAISHVFNYDLPRSGEDYVHRIGRTGRAGRDGLAISLVNHEEKNTVRVIERYTRNQIPVDIVVGYEPTRTAVARPKAARKPVWGKTVAKPGVAKRDGYRDAHDNRNDYGRREGPKGRSGGSARTGGTYASARQR